MSTTPHIDAAAAADQIPNHILIVGSGVFGLTTALALASRETYKQSRITIVDRSPFPAPDGSSIDSSRIIRAEYENPFYAALAADGLQAWRRAGPGELGGEGRYHETGMLLVCTAGSAGEHYVRESLRNSRALARERGDADDGIQVVETRAQIEALFGERCGDEALGCEVVGGAGADWGYLSTGSGWANAELTMRWVREQAGQTGRIEFLVGEVESLIWTAAGTVSGVRLKGSEDGSSSSSTLTADLTILATGAWTSRLIDGRGQITANGQALCYMPITPATQARLAHMPVILNMSTGLFAIPPRHNELKIARHGWGYANPQPVEIRGPAGVEAMTISVPRTTFDDAEGEKSASVPTEGLQACADFLQAIFPDLAGPPPPAADSGTPIPSHPFTRSRICWYTDTPTADFLISYVPGTGGTLFVATGGSGHGFKFLPVIGERIADVVGAGWSAAGRRRACWRGFDLGEAWGWRGEEGGGSRDWKLFTEDGSRGGRKGMLLDEEMGV